MHRAGAQSCLSPWNTIDYSLPGSSVHGIFQARILEWVAISFSRGSSSPKDWTLVSCVSFFCRKLLYHWAPWEGRYNAWFSLSRLSFCERWLSLWYEMCSQYRESTPDTWKAEEEPLTQHVPASDQPWRDCVATPVQVLLMLTQPPNHSHTSLLQTQPLTEDNRTHHQFERPTLSPCEKALRNRHLLFPMRALTGQLCYLDEIKKCQGQ